MIVTSGGHTVSCLTDNNDGTVTLRLSPDRAEDGTRTERAVTLAEPSLREYAELRTLIVDTHEAVQQQFPQPPAPTIPEDQARTAEGKRIANEYADAVQQWTLARNRHIKSVTDENGNERVPPYAACMIAVVDRLAVPGPNGTGNKITVDDLVPEALQPRTYTGLLEVWDAPLGGPADPTTNPFLRALAEVVNPAPPTAVPESADPPVPDSPAPEESSLPGTEDSPPSPQAPSTP